MRTTLSSVTAFALAVLLLASCGKKEPDIVLKEPGFKKYPFKSAVVEYTFSGDATGKMMQYIDHYGVREATEDNSTVTIMGQEQKNNTLTIFDQDTLYMIDLGKKEGTRMKNPNWDSMIQQFKGMTEDQKKNFAVSSIEMLTSQQGMKKSGTEDILGYSCDVYEGQGYRFCYWNGVLLKMDADMGGMKVKMLATKFEEDVDIPSSRFMPPEDVKMQSMDPHQQMGMPQGSPDAGAEQDPHAGMEMPEKENK